MGDEYLREYASVGDIYEFDSMWIEIAAAKNVNTGSDSMIAWAADGIEQCCQQLYDGGYISGYDIDLYDTTLEINDGDDVLTKWANHRDEQGWTWDASWMLCHKSDQDGTAAGGDTAFANEKGCHQNKDSYWVYGKEVWKAYAAHEILHNFLYTSGCDKIQDRYDVNNDHQLGDEYDVGHGEKRTPMVGGHDDEASVGYCDGDVGASDADLVLDMNDCEKDAVRLSAEHEDGQH